MHIVQILKIIDILKIQWHIPLISHFQTHLSFSKVLVKRAVKLLYHCSSIETRVQCKLNTKNVETVCTLRKKKHKKGIIWTKCSFCTILTDIHADGIYACKIDHRRLHGVARRPHVVEQEDGHSRKAKHTEPGHTQDVREEHKLCQNVELVSKHLQQNSIFYNETSHKALFKHVLKNKPRCGCVNIPFH